ncbi:carbon storage regulator [Rubinisphaera italica]|uniref:Carbon storage regulator n=1 Tax=Rubinisphaera italica TaxID=2527969 RepID=A0A5C5XCH4_9PLAN|nr:carbon storage regulator [Rubinisphaera italica]TWT59875.1 Carbon storage regulator [Rubinisphaera italica]HBN78319.1 hypothetical protein [Planctomycetaceae bacterium]|tara:strand:- start:186 stop:377 length:192 start_codon:yes stop_codon:yes gene_type:complete
MKVLSRSVSESFVIDDHIMVTVKAIKKEMVVLSLESLRNEFPYREETITLNQMEQVLPEALKR